MTSEAAQYFSKPAYRRLFQMAKKKYESLGRIGGQIRLSSLSSDEKEALSGLLAKDLHKQKSVTIALADLNEKLLSTRFQIDLLTLLSLLFSEKIKSKAEQKLEEQGLWEAFFSFLQSFAAHPTVSEWLTSLQSGKSGGYRIIKERFDDVKADLRSDKRPSDPLSFRWLELVRVIEGLNRLPIFGTNRSKTAVPLPIFAATVAGDAHFFDRDRVSGRLFYYGILFVNRSQADDVENPSLIRTQYRNAGLMLDDLSSQVLVAGATYKDGRRKEYSYSLTLRMLESWRKGKIDPQSFPHDWLHAALQTKKVYISENPSICTYLLDRLKETSYKRCVPPLVCTSGQPSHAALELFDFLTDHGIQMYYSGDFDVKGLSIAQTLYERYQDHWHPWGMTSEAISQWKIDRIQRSESVGVPFSEEETNALTTMKTSWDETLLNTLLASENAIKIFQEMLVPLLWEEYKRNVPS